MQGGATLLGARQLLAGLSGSKLCYGEPVRSGERMIIPVSRVTGYGGAGWGRGVNDGGEDGSGGGAGGSLDAAPVGFIEVGPEGARFASIPDPVGTARAIKTGAGALSAIATGIAAVVALRRGRQLRPGHGVSRLLPRG